MRQKLRILILEDNPADAELAQRELEKAGLSFAASIVATRGEFLQQLDVFDPDIILSDYKLPGFDGISAMRVAVARKPEIPFIFVTGEMGEERAIDTLKEGATDYVLKQRLARLGPAVERALAEVEEKSQRRRAEENYRTVFETTGTAMCVLGEDSVVLSANRGFERLLGYAVGESEPEVRFKQVVSRDGPEVEDFYRYHREVLSEGETDPVFFKTRVVSRDGSTLDVLASMGRLPGTRNSVLSLIDITREKQFAGELKERAERLRDFLTVASHEIRHPITVIKGYAEMLGNGDMEIPEDMVPDIYASMNDAADRLTRIVTELMDVSRIENDGIELDMALHDIKELVLEAVADERGARAARHVELEVLSDPGQVVVDRARIIFVLDQLLDNAEKYSPKGSPPSVTLESGLDGPLVSVLDRGPGIPEPDRERVFERFYQVEDVLHHSKPGMGLGLFIARRIVDAHGGRIWCEPRDGGGSAFRFSIPK